MDFLNWIHRVRKHVRASFFHTLTRVIYCYILFITEVNSMTIIINNTSMQPIYEQIVSQMKAAIMQGKLKEEAALPSVRSLAKDLHVSALTVKKAYDALEEQGFIVTVHGKGSFVACANQELLLEEKRKEVESDLEAVIRKSRSIGMTDSELKALFTLIMED